MHASMPWFVSKKNCGSAARLWPEISSLHVELSEAMQRYRVSRPFLRRGSITCMRLCLGFVSEKDRGSVARCGSRYRYDRLGVPHLQVSDVACDAWQVKESARRADARSRRRSMGLTVSVASPEELLAGGATDDEKTKKRGARSKTRQHAFNPRQRPSPGPTDRVDTALPEREGDLRDGQLERGCEVEDEATRIQPKTKTASGAERPCGSSFTRARGFF